MSSKTPCPGADCSFNSNREKGKQQRVWEQNYYALENSYKVNYFIRSYYCLSYVIKMSSLGNHKVTHGWKSFYLGLSQLVTPATSVRFCWIQGVPDLMMFCYLLLVASFFNFYFLYIQYMCKFNIQSMTVVHCDSYYTELRSSWLRLLPLQDIDKSSTCVLSVWLYHRKYQHYFSQ